MPSQPTSSISSTCCLRTDSPLIDCPLVDCRAIQAEESPTAPVSVRSWALSILESPDLATKLHSPALLVDDDPGAALVILEPARTEAMRFQRRTKICNRCDM